MPRSGRRSARSRQDRLHGGDAALLGAPGTAQGGPARRRQHGGARADPRVGTRGARTAPGQRDTAQGISVFCSGGARPPAQAIDGSAVDPVPPGSRCPGHRQGSRSSTIIAPPTGSSRSARCCRSPRPPTTPMRRTGRTRLALRPGRGRDTAPCLEIRRVFEEHFRVYGVRQVWRQLGREGITVARCTVARLMRRMGRRGAVRGRSTRTTVPDRDGVSPDRVQRQFTPPQPNRLWVSDFTYVATWHAIEYGQTYSRFIIKLLTLPRLGGHGLRPTRPRRVVLCGLG